MWVFFLFHKELVDQMNGGGNFDFFLGYHLLSIELEKGVKT